MASIPVTIGAQILVSDDSIDDGSKLLVESQFPHVTWIPGPRLGLGANRNAAISCALGRYILFLDDDAALGPSFLDMALKMTQGDHRTIVTGQELNNGRLVFPRKTTFLGHQKVRYGDSEEFSTIVINATIFPREMFSTVSFDGTLIFGYDEIDVCAQAIAAGYRIIYCSDAVNFHYPSSSGRDYYRGQTEISRIYVTYKIYRWLDGGIAKAWIFFALASIHFFAFTLKRQGLRSWHTAWTDWRNILRRVKGSKPRGVLCAGKP